MSSDLWRAASRLRASHRTTDAAFVAAVANSAGTTSTSSASSASARVGDRTPSSVSADPAQPFFDTVPEITADLMELCGPHTVDVPLSDTENTGAADAAARPVGVTAAVLQKIATLCDGKNTDGDAASNGPDNTWTVSTGAVEITFRRSTTDGSSTTAEVTGEVSGGGSHGLTATLSVPSVSPQVRHHLETYMRELSTVLGELREAESHCVSQEWHTALRVLFASMNAIPTLLRAAPALPPVACSAQQHVPNDMNVNAGTASTSAATPSAPSSNAQAAGASKENDNAAVIGGLGAGHRGQFESHIGGHRQAGGPEVLGRTAPPMSGGGVPPRGGAQPVTFAPGSATQAATAVFTSVPFTLPDPKALTHTANTTGTPTSPLSELLAPAALSVLESHPQFASALAVLDSMAHYSTVDVHPAAVGVDSSNMDGEREHGSFNPAEGLSAVGTPEDTHKAQQASVARGASAVRGVASPGTARRFGSGFSSVHGSPTGLASLRPSTGTAAQMATDAFLQEENTSAGRGSRHHPFAPGQAANLSMLPHSYPSASVSAAGSPAGRGSTGPAAFAAAMKSTTPAHAHGTAVGVGASMSVSRCGAAPMSADLLSSGGGVLQGRGSVAFSPPHREATSNFEHAADGRTAAVASGGASGGADAATEDVASAKKANEKDESGCVDLEALTKSDLAAALSGLATAFFPQVTQDGLLAEKEQLITDRALPILEVINEIVCIQRLRIVARAYTALRSWAPAGRAGRALTHAVSDHAAATLAVADRAWCSAVSAATVSMANLSKQLRGAKRMYTDHRATPSSAARPDVSLVKGATGLFTPSDIAAVLAARVFVPITAAVVSAPSSTSSGGKGKTVASTSLSFFARWSCVLSHVTAPKIEALHRMVATLAAVEADLALGSAALHDGKNAAPIPTAEHCVLLAFANATDDDITDVVLGGSTATAFSPTRRADTVNNENDEDSQPMMETENKGSGGADPGSARYLVTLVPSADPQSRGPNGAPAFVYSKGAEPTTAPEFYVRALVRDPFCATAAESLRKHWLLPPAELRQLFFMTFSIDCVDISGSALCASSARSPDPTSSAIPATPMPTAGGQNVADIPLPAVFNVAAGQPGAAANGSFTSQHVTPGRCRAVRVRAKLAMAAQPNEDFFLPSSHGTPLHQTVVDKTRRSFVIDLPPSCAALRVTYVAKLQLDVHGDCPAAVQALRHIQRDVFGAFTLPATSSSVCSAVEFEWAELEKQMAAQTVEMNADDTGKSSAKEKTNAIAASTVDVVASVSAFEGLSIASVLYYLSSTSTSSPSSGDAALGFGDVFASLAQISGFVPETTAAQVHGGAPAGTDGGDEDQACGGVAASLSAASVSLEWLGALVRHFCRIDVLSHPLMPYALHTLLSDDMVKANVTAASLSVVEQLRRASPAAVVFTDVPSSSAHDGRRAPMSAHEIRSALLHLADSLSASPKSLEASSPSHQQFGPLFQLFKSVSLAILFSKATALLAAVPPVMAHYAAAADLCQRGAGSAAFVNENGAVSALPGPGSRLEELEVEATTLDSVDQNIPYNTGQQKAASARFGRAPSVTKSKDMNVHSGASKTAAKAETKVSSAVMTAVKSGSGFEFDGAFIPAPPLANGHAFTRINNSTASSASFDPMNAVGAGSAAPYAPDALLKAVELTLVDNPIDDDAVTLKLRLLHDRRSEPASLFDYAHQVVSLAPGTGLAAYAVGVYYYALTAFDKAGRFFARATELRPDLACAWIAYAHCYSKLEEGHQACTVYRQCKVLFPHFTLPAVLLGLQFSRSDATPVAMGFLTEALKQNTRDPLVLNELGVLAFRRKEYTTATALFGRALKILRAGQLSRSLGASQKTTARVSIAQRRKAGRARLAAARNDTAAIGQTPHFSANRDGRGGDDAAARAETSPLGLYPGPSPRSSWIGDVGTATVRDLLGLPAGQQQQQQHHLDPTTGLVPPSSLPTAASVRAGHPQPTSAALGRQGFPAQENDKENSPRGSGLRSGGAVSPVAADTAAGILAAAGLRHSVDGAAAVASSVSPPPHAQSVTGPGGSAGVEHDAFTASILERGTFFAGLEDIQESDNLVTLTNSALASRRLWQNSPVAKTSTSASRDPKTASEDRAADVFASISASVSTDAATRAVWSRRMTELASIAASPSAVPVFSMDPCASARKAALIFGTSAANTTAQRTKSNRCAGSNGTGSNLDVMSPPSGLSTATAGLSEYFDCVVFNMGTAMRKLRNYAGAIACYEEFARLRPFAVSAHSALGFTKHLAGDVQAAIEHYHTALGIKSDGFTRDLLERALAEQYARGVGGAGWKEIASIAAVSAPIAAPAATTAATGTAPASVPTTAAPATRRTATVQEEEMPPPPAPLMASPIGRTSVSDRPSVGPTPTAHISLSSLGLPSDDASAAYGPEGVRRSGGDNLFRHVPHQDPRGSAEYADPAAFFAMASPPNPMDTTRRTPQSAPPAVSATPGALDRTTGPAGAGTADVRSPHGYPAHSHHSQVDETPAAAGRVAGGVPQPPQWTPGAPTSGGRPGQAVLPADAQYMGDEDATAEGRPSYGMQVPPPVRGKRAVSTESLGEIPAVEPSPPRRRRREEAPPRPFDDEEDEPMMGRPSQLH